MTAGKGDFQEIGDHTAFRRRSRVPLRGAKHGSSLPKMHTAQDAYRGWQPAVLRNPGPMLRLSNARRILRIVIRARVEKAGALRILLRCEHPEGPRHLSSAANAGPLLFMSLNYNSSFIFFRRVQFWTLSPALTTDGLGRRLERTRLAMMAARCPPPAQRIRQPC